jgi:hypothetical protein
MSDTYTHGPLGKAIARPRRIETPVVIQGRQVAKAVAEVVDGAFVKLWIEYPPAPVPSVSKEEK